MNLGRIGCWFGVACWFAGSLGACWAQEEQTSGFAPRVESLEAFAHMPVLYEGRKMPLDTFARYVLFQFSGRHTIGKKPAIDWLARLLFVPRQTVEDKIFLINHPDIPRALGVSEAKRRRYSFSQISPSLERLRELAMAAVNIEKEHRSVVDNELIRVYSNLNTYMGLSHSFQFDVPRKDFPLDNEVRAYLGVDADTDALSFLQLFNRLKKIREVVEPLQEKDQAEWSALEKSLFDLSVQLFQLTQQGQDMLPTFIPVQAGGEEVWISTWEAVPFIHRVEAIREHITTLTQLHAAYLAGQQLEFDMAARAFRRSIEGLYPDDKELSTNGLEVRYNELKLFSRAKWFYGLAFFLAFAALVSNRRTLRLGAMAVLGVAFLPHTMGIVMRMMIMGRPPMTNLYATFLFVAWISVLLCFLMEYAQKNGLGLLTSSVSGLALLMLSSRFASEGDALGKVVAVLDSNFWLSTHVVCITTGYAGCFVAGIVGHAYVLQCLFAPHRTDRLDALIRALFGVLGFGLTFSFFGTMLGGVWADQSWGRFWGWDPKENGALLIVLWCAILFHARLGHLIGDLGMAQGSILGMIVVAFAWLGVNVLGVGLHSYGFTSGLALSLRIYYLAQLSFVVLTSLVLVSRQKHAT